MAHEINVHEGIGLHPPKPFVKKKVSSVEPNAESEDSPTSAKTEPNFWDVMPYPQFFIGFAVGALAIAYASNWYFESKYGVVMEALPTYERARDKADENDAKIRQLVADNTKNAEIMKQSADKIIEWASRMEPKKQSVVNQ